MLYDPAKDNHGLPYNPFKSCVVPRPIAWISTRSLDGVDNLAPFSQFQNLTFDPPFVMIACNQYSRRMRKNTTVNIEQTGEFVYNMVTYDLREAMNRSSEEAPPEVDEFELAGVTKAPSSKVRPWRVAESPIQVECIYHQTIRLPGIGERGTVDIIFGKVVMVHIRDDIILPNGKIDILKIRPLARLGYYDYTSIESVFEMIMPANDKDTLYGLAGASVIASRK